MRERKKEYTEFSHCYWNNNKSVVTDVVYTFEEKENERKKRTSCEIAVCFRKYAFDMDIFR